MNENQPQQPNDSSDQNQEQQTRQQQEQQEELRVQQEMARQQEQTRQEQEQDSGRAPMKSASESEYDDAKNSAPSSPVHAESANVPQNLVAPDNQDVPEDNNAEPSDAEVQHLASEGEVENQA